MAHAIRLHCRKAQGLLFHGVAGDAEQKKHPAQKMDHQIADARPIRRARARAPQDEHRSDRHHLPEDEDGEQIARESHADRRGGVEKGGGQFEAPGLPQPE
jgi:hypothetical protein